MYESFTLGSWPSVPLVATTLMPGHGGSDGDGDGDDGGDDGDGDDGGDDGDGDSDGDDGGVVMMLVMVVVVMMMVMKTKSAKGNTCQKTLNRCTRSALRRECICWPFLQPFPRSQPIVTVVLQWCCSGVTVGLQCAIMLSL
jgi:hypothetical protein